MADVFSKKKRSLVMAAIRGGGNLSTEWKLRARLISHGITGWRINATDKIGKPDFVFDKKRVAVFVDGCFWHGCRLCRNIPTSNRKFWAKKINANRNRDRKVTRSLKKTGWRVVRIWEHEIKQNSEKSLRTIRGALKNRPDHREKREK